MKETKETKNRTVSFYLSKEAIEKLTKLAKRESRTFSNMLDIIIKKYKD